MWIDLLLVLVAVLPLFWHADAPSTTSDTVSDPAAEQLATRPLAHLSAAPTVLLRQEPES